MKPGDGCQPRKIRAASYDQPKVTDASQSEIMTQDLSAWKSEPTSYACTAGPETAERQANSMMQFCIGREWLRGDDAIAPSLIAFGGKLHMPQFQWKLSG